ncbi:Riboflavin biosynthesis protein PYRR, chloroplastic-like [Oopsacas minuta]|uniref:Riboflavin biosynthesis protein PYRR, chloroplastic-like n=1 Tax=Oopsacas minuta TaxID=111878 RepID=A0AAV7K8B2_9METZ|nr:Riboflavin biosynthesis protein PYRR, chloroplastic-like [Oopsacas minuta]
MASDSRTGWGPFLMYWASFCKDTFIPVSISGQVIQFFEGLLNTLCYETDVGCIPRGFKLNTAGDNPKYFHSNNWNKQIDGCYWCKDDNTDYNGICCTKECFFYLHDWCVERVHYFTNRRFCRFPGCDTNTKDNHLYCGTKHNGYYDSEFPKGSDHKILLKTVIREGPSWYCSNGGLSNVPLQQISNSTSQITKPPPKQKIQSQGNGKNKTNDTSANFDQIMEFPIDLHNAMIFQTDIGIIPRTKPNENHLISPYSSSPNWLRQIEGCYWCGNKSIGNDNFCRYRCYLIFYEWCRSKVCSLTGVNMCRNTGCNKTAADGFDCCSREHTIAIKEKYSQVRKIDSERLTAIGPDWYKKRDIPDVNRVNNQRVNANHSQNPVSPPAVPQQSTPPKQYSPSPGLQHCVFSWELTEFLYYFQDVGPIPRKLIQFIPMMNNIPNPNWNVDIPLCYWCCTNQLRMNCITCSDRCIFLLNEWVHCLYTNTSKKKLCRVMGCKFPSAYGFDCCNRTHSKEYERFNQYSHLLKSTEFALGPRWYHDYSLTPINFYNRNEPFYELTNFYPCSNLVIDNMIWPTTEHYFQACKFAGTPYVYFVSQLQAPRDAFDFSRNPGVQRWVRTNWPKIKMQVMLKALRCKFNQNIDLAQILIRTGEKLIFEHTKNDKFWGDGGDGKGMNKLGELLMVVRTELQCSQQPMLNTFQPIQMKDFVPINFAPTNSSNTQIIPSQSNMNENNILPQSSIQSPMHISETRVARTKSNTTNSCTEDLINLNASPLSTNYAPQTSSQGDSLTQIPAQVIPPINPPEQTVACNASATDGPLFEVGKAKRDLDLDYNNPFQFSQGSDSSSTIPNTPDTTDISKDVNNPFLHDNSSDVDMTETNTDKINPFLTEENSLTQPNCSVQTQANRPSIPKASGDVGMPIDNSIQINFRLSDVKNRNTDLSPESTPLPLSDNEDMETDADVN